MLPPRAVPSGAAGEVLLSLLALALDHQRERVGIAGALVWRMLICPKDRSAGVSCSRGSPRLGWSTSTLEAMTRITIEVPDDVAERVNAAAAEQGIAPEALAGQAVAEQFPARRRRLSFAAIGSSTSGRRAAEDEEMLAEGGFGIDSADR